MKNAYTEDSIWRNRNTFLKGHDEIVAFLTSKWEKENGYRLRKELFAFEDNKVGQLVECRRCVLSKPDTAMLAVKQNSAG